MFTYMYACMLYYIHTPPSESQRSSCIDIKVCDQWINWLVAGINLATSFLWCHLSRPPPTVNPFNPHSDPLIQSIFSLSSVYFRMTAAELLFFLQTLRGLEQCLLCDPWPVIHSHHVKRSHMGRIKLQWHINKYRWKIHYHWHNYSFSVNFKIFFVFYFLLFFKFTLNCTQSIHVHCKYWSRCWVK